MSKVEPASTFRAIIDNWPTVAEYARAMKVRYQRAWRWYDRDSVPPRYWATMIDAARERGVPLSSDDLMSITTQDAEVEVKPKTKRAARLQ